MIITQDLPKRNPHCSECQKPLLRGEQILSVLFDEPPFRKDFCEKCSPNHSSGGIQWKSTIPLKQKSPHKNLKKRERALAVFHDLIKEPKDRWGEIFILALYLEREKVIVMRQNLVSPQGIPISIYEVIETEELIKIPRLDPKKLPIDEIQTSLAALLNI